MGVTSLSNTDVTTKQDIGRSGVGRQLKRRPAFVVLGVRDQRFRRLARGGGGGWWLHESLHVSDGRLSVGGQGSVRELPVDGVAE